MKYGVMVIGAGHAGCEAALAAARMGVKTALLAADRAAIARMSCNPSIGGIAKSHIVHEIDALGGEMAANTDYTGIQFRTLNTKKGPAVQATRVQCDKAFYPTRMQAVVEQTANLDVIETLAADIWIENGKLRGVRDSNGETLAAETVVITAGTFLRGKIHIGDESFEGGRIGEKAAYDLSTSLESLGFRLRRLKTGTPPRIHKDSIDYDCMELQAGLEPPPMFSWRARRELFHVEQSGDDLFHVEQSDIRPWLPGSDQIPCHLTHTTPETHAIIENNLTRSAMYGGQIDATGVRYCPSIEDKIVRFRDKSSHHIFIEPEGRMNDLIYPNGISNSLPKEVQDEFVRSIPGLSRAELVNYAYAIEYDFSDPTQLNHSLESKLVENLYFAGQVNGTTGYEEAAGQGLIAGINAAIKVIRGVPLILSRHESYIGVLVDDLVIKGTDEPYRMFTSRAEHRLMLRQDNARYRMQDHAARIGIVDPDMVSETRRYADQVESEIERLKRVRSGDRTLAQVLRRPDMSYGELDGRDETLPEEVARQVEITLKYDGYIQRDLDRIEKARGMEEKVIPDWVDYDAIKSLRTESRQKLNEIQPRTIGQAARISGINPADIAILSVVIKRGRA